MHLDTSHARSAPPSSSSTGTHPSETRAGASRDRAPSTPLLVVDDLAVSFDNASDPGAPRVQAVSGVQMTIHPRQTLAVVGESGCGKSVTAMSTMRLIPTPPGRYDRGRILFEGRDLLAMPERELLAVRGKDIAMIFQEPMTSLNPVYTVGDQILEAILLHQNVNASTAREIALQAMRDVGIPRAEERIDQYPHQFSGGMRQRIMIAMALACQPKLLLADEPTTALDVTIQAQILELLKELQRTRGMSVMLITHNLGVVAENADVICVMYGGRVVEYASVYDLFDRPLHPYTRGLFSSIPDLRARRGRLTTVADVVDDPAEFTGLSAIGAGAVMPWWPTMRPPGPPGPPVHTGTEGVRPPSARRGGTADSDVPAEEALAATARGTGDSSRETILVEVEPDHWVGCWRTDALAALPHRRADLAFRRGAAGGAD